MCKGLCPIRWWKLSLTDRVWRQGHVPWRGKLLIHIVSSTFVKRKPSFPAHFSWYIWWDLSTILRARFWTQIKFKLTAGLQSECGKLPCLDALLNTAEIHFARLLHMEAFHLSGITPIGSRLNFMISSPLCPYLFKINNRLENRGF